MNADDGEHEDAVVLPYASPAALRAALTAKIKAAVRADPSHGFAELARQIGYDRLLARLDWGGESEKDMWVLKGATALLARLRTAARHSLDIDLYRKDTTDVADAERALRQAAARDLGDFFTFDFGRAAPLVDAAKGVRIPVVARLGPPWSRFHVDVVVGLSMTGQPDTVAPLTAIEILGLNRVPYRAYPIADHIARQGRRHIRTAQLTYRSTAGQHPSQGRGRPAHHRPDAERRRRRTLSSRSIRDSTPGTSDANRLHGPRRAGLGQQLAHRRGQVPVSDQYVTGRCPAHDQGTP